MADITNPQAVRFCNEQIRLHADKLAPVASVTPVFNVPPAPLTPFVIEAKAGDLKLTNVLTIPPRKIVLEGPDGTFEGRAE